LHSINRRGVLEYHPCLITEHDSREQRKNAAEDQQEDGKYVYSTAERIALIVSLAGERCNTDPDSRPTSSDHCVEIE